MRFLEAVLRLGETPPQASERSGDHRCMVWRNGRAWAVDILPIGDHHHHHHHHDADSPMALRIPAWKRHAGCDLYVLMLHVDYDAHYQAPLTTRPRLQFLGAALVSL